MTRVAVDLSGQTAIVTGGGGGIGRAIALTLAGAGANIVIAEIIPERCENVAAEVRALGRRVIAPRTDMADTEQIRTMVGEARREFGRIDILVNNVGGVGRKPFLEMSERSWRRQIDLNFVSMLAATAAAVPVIIEGGRGGAIINVSSIEGSRAAPNFSVYAACKAAMNGFTRTLALELSGYGIRINAIAPDFTETPGTRGNLTGPVDPASWIPFTPEQADANARRIPLGRPGIDMECGQAALFLASPMSSYITGATLPVDGGAWASSGWVRDRQGKWTLIEVPSAREPT
jgi:NAD(P)-dependent dehydrogenase (short-subunit alcohol dehydrogenase family)